MLTEEYLALLDIARFAPSAHNTQPWEVLLGGSFVEVRRSEARSLDVGDPSGRQTGISLGIFTEFLRLAAMSRGFRGDVQLTAGPSSISAARVDLAVGRSSADAQRLVAAVSQRKTVRGAFDSELPPSFVPSCEDAADLYEAELVLLDEPAEVKEVADLVGQATRIALTLPPMRRELAGLVHWSDEEATTGMSIQSMLGDCPKGREPAGQFFLDHLNPHAEAARFQTWYANAAALFVVGTSFDGPEAWMLAGQLAARLMLEAAAQGLSQDVSAGPIEVPSVLPALRGVVRSDLRPQILMRFGVPVVVPSYPPAPRLPASALLAVDHS